MPIVNARFTVFCSNSFCLIDSQSICPHFNFPQRLLVKCNSIHVFWGAFTKCERFFTKKKLLCWFKFFFILLWKGWGKVYRIVKMETMLSNSCEIFINLSWQNDEKKAEQHFFFNIILWVTRSRCYAARVMRLEGMEYWLTKGNCEANELDEVCAEFKFFFWWVFFCDDFFSCFIWNFLWIWRRNR